MTKSIAYSSSAQWAPWSAIAEDLAGLKAQHDRILFIANPGNAGDALIASATWQLFDDIALQPTLARGRDIRAGDAVIYGGGGNLVPMYNDAHDVLETALREGVSQFILLPHTVRGHEELLSKLDVRFRLYGRDLVTWEHLRRCAPHASVALAPDLALGMDVHRLQQRAANLPTSWLWRWAGFRLRRLKAYRRWLRASSRFQPDHSGLLELYRSDVEAAESRSLPRQDLSCWYRSALSCRNECDAVAFQFLEVINRATTLSTDRLHVAIGGQLLNKTVQLLDNSYGKNRAVVSAFPSLMSNVRLPPPHLFS